MSFTGIPAIQEEGSTIFGSRWISVQEIEARDPSEARHRGEELKEMVIKELHDEIAHHALLKATYEQVARRSQWRGMYVDVEKWVKSCDECQRRST